MYIKASIEAFKIVHKDEVQRRMRRYAEKFNGNSPILITITCLVIGLLEKSAANIFFRLFLVFAKNEVGI